MPRHPEIQTEVMPGENTVRLSFSPAPEDQHIYEISEWMERVPGITSVVPGLGSIALRAADPPFPLEACRAEVQKVAGMYFEHPEEKTRAVESDLFNYAWIDELRRVFSETQLAGSLRMERHSAREFDPADLFIVSNSQIPTNQEPPLATEIMGQDKRVYSALVVDNG